MNEDITINGSKIPPGSVTTIDIPIARLPTHTEISLPVCVYRSVNPGKTLLLTAGLHGDEINGIEILRRLMTDRKIKLQQGNLIVIPVVNIFGFLHFSRDLPDGKDLNRSFPGSSAGSLARQIAYVLVNEILPQVDFGIDLHTGGASRSNFPQVRCLFSDNVSLELARAFNPPFIINSKLIDKSFRKAAHLRKKAIIVYEGGESLRFDEFAIKEGLRGILRVMNYLNMCDYQDIIPNSAILLGKTRWVRAKSAGIARTLVETGSLVEKSQVLGTVSDPFGEKKTLITSPISGYLIGQNYMPVLNRGDALFHIGES